MLDTAKLTGLLEALKSAEVFGSTDPAQVNVPGAWLALDEVRPRVMSGDHQLRCSLYLIAPDVDTLRALEQLGDLYDKTLTVLTPDGPTTTLGVVLPDSSTPLPALRVPIYL